MTEQEAQEFATLEAEQEKTQSEAPTKESKETKAATGNQESLALKTIGDRPVSGGKLQIFGTFRSMGMDRPIIASQLEVVETFRSMGGERPIFATQLPTVGNFYSSGNRPIGASTLNISENYSNFGNRPVASNQTDDPLSLMGYID